MVILPSTLPSSGPNWAYLAAWLQAVVAARGITDPSLSPLGTDSDNTLLRKLALIYTNTTP